MRVVLEHPTYAPLTSEEEEVLASEVGDTLCIVRELKALGIEALVFNPAYLRVAEVSATKITAVLTL